MVLSVTAGKDNADARSSHATGAQKDSETRSVDSLSTSTILFYMCWDGWIEP